MIAYDDLFIAVAEVVPEAYACYLHAEIDAFFARITIGYDGDAAEHVGRSMSHECNAGGVIEVIRLWTVREAPARLD